MKSLKTLNLSPGQKVFLRADLDVAIENGKVSDDFRLKKILPTIQYLLAKKAQIILAGHLGRPHGKEDPKLSLKPVADWFIKQGLNIDFSMRSHLLRTPAVTAGVQSRLAGPGATSPEIILLENLRFDIREEENDAQFAKEMAGLADIYVNEAFAASYEEHASIVGIPKLLPIFAGLQFEKEVNTLSQIFKNPQRPLIFLVGGVKPEKAALIPSLAKIADTVLVNGQIANILEVAPVKKDPAVKAGSFTPILNRGRCDPSRRIVFPIDSINQMDLGSQTITMYLEILKQSKTTVWSGPLGKYEEQNYSKSTKAIAEYLLNPNDQSLVIIGGGDTIAALHQFNLLNQLDQKPNCFISTGGGAMLQFLAQGTLPGIEALSPKR